MGCVRAADTDRAVPPSLPKRYLAFCSSIHPLSLELALNWVRKFAKGGVRACWGGLDVWIRLAAAQLGCPSDFFLARVSSAIILTTSMGSRAGEAIQLFLGVYILLLGLNWLCTGLSSSSSSSATSLTASGFDLSPWWDPGEPGHPPLLVLVVSSSLRGPLVLSFLGWPSLLLRGAG